MSVQFYTNGETSPIPSEFLALFLIPLFGTVGYQWASTILAILAAVMGAFPIMFYKFGPQIRRRSRYAQELATLEEEERRRLKFIEAQFYREETLGEGS